MTGATKVGGSSAATGMESVGAWKRIGDGHFARLLWSRRPTAGRWVVGRGGILSGAALTAVGVHATDGVNWTDVNNPSGGQLNAVAMVSATDGWAVGNGAILRYTGVAPTYRTYLPIVTR